VIPHDQLLRFVQELSTGFDYCHCLALGRTGTIVCAFRVAVLEFVPNPVPQRLTACGIRPFINSEWRWKTCRCWTRFSASHSGWCSSRLDRVGFAADGACSSTQALCYPQTASVRLPTIEAADAIQIALKDSFVAQSVRCRFVLLDFLPSHSNPLDTGLFPSHFC